MSDHCAVRNKGDAVDDLVSSGGLDVLGVTESWHEGSSCVCITRLRALGYSVVEEADLSHRKRTWTP